MALNHISIMGRLTKDVELRYTQTQKPVASFTLAVDRDFGDKQTDFVNCVAWNKTAEFVSKYFNKGKMAIVAGRLQMREYTDKNGNKRTAAEVIAENVYFGDSKKSDRDSYESDSDDSDLKYTRNNAFDDLDMEDDLPF